jgi:hypothetical protein
MPEVRILQAGFAGGTHRLKSVLLELRPYGHVFQESGQDWRAIRL